MGARGWTEPRPCAECGTPMRPGRGIQAAAGVWAGTRRHYGRGLCQNCYRRPGFRAAHPLQVNTRKKETQTRPVQRRPQMTITGRHATAVCGVSQGRTLAQEKARLQAWMDDALTALGMRRTSRSMFRVGHGMAPSLTATTTVTEVRQP